LSAKPARSVPFDAVEERRLHIQWAALTCIRIGERAEQYRERGMHGVADAVQRSAEHAAREAFAHSRALVELQAQTAEVTA
jgi:hypothetical protein